MTAIIDHSPYRSEEQGAKDFNVATDPTDFDVATDPMSADTISESLDNIVRRFGATGLSGFKEGPTNFCLDSGPLDEMMRSYESQHPFDKAPPGVWSPQSIAKR